jgi:hypothetical protein
LSIGVCIFPEGDPNKDTSDPITLGQARALVSQMIDKGCKVCGQIPIHYLDRNVTNAPNNGGLLKADYRVNDNCIDKCAGPLSFKGNSTTGSPTAAASHFAAKRLRVRGLFEGGIADWFFPLLPVMVAFTSSSVIFLTV